jgi:hypothetical protein
MTDEVKKAIDQLKEGQPAQEEQVEQTPQLTEIEQKALEMGWRPKSEFDGDEEDFIDAKEFVRRKPLFDKIETQSKEIKNVRKAVEALKQHYSAREEAAVKAALAKLQDAKEEAINNSDGAAVRAIESEIKRTETEAARLKELDAESQEQPTVHPEFAAWTNRNRWYTETGYMRNWADDYGRELHRQGMNPLEVLKKVEAQVKKEFPHKFTNPNKGNAPDVEAGGRGQGGKSSDKFQLTEQEQKVMKTLVSTKVMSEADYIAQVKAMRGVK